MKKLIIVCLFSLLLLTFPAPVRGLGNATGVPYKTYTLGVNRRLVETETAFVPVGILNHDYLLNNPQDIQYRSGYLVVANMGAKNVAIFRATGQFVRTIGVGILNQPTGVFVDEDLNIFVADKANKAAYLFDFEGNLLQTFIRPEEPLFGDTSNYTPEKIVVDKGGNIYITGEGSTNGIIQLNRDGIFRGYFGVNQTRFDWRMVFSDWFLGFTDELAKNLPPAAVNLAIDHLGIVYTITSNIDEGIKKYNMMSVVILSTRYTPEELLVDIAVDQYNNMYVVDVSGQIHLYDQYGRLLFRFGGLDTGNQLLGLVNKPTGITVDESGNLYVLDSGYNNIQIFYPTEFVVMINEGNFHYSQGNLEMSKSIWEELHKLNSTFSVANSTLGDIYMREEMYDQAIDHYELAQDRTGYSEAFWEIRNLWLQERAGVILVIILSLVGLNLALVLTKSKKKLTTALVGVKSYLSTRSWTEPFTLLRRMLKNPADAFYQIKREKKGSMLSATILYLTLFVLMVLSYFITSFLFSRIDANRVNLLMEFVQLVGILWLFVFANYLISTLADGEGWFKEIYRASSYALAPLIFGLIPLAILSNVLTYNEMFIYTLSRTILYGWTAINLFIMVKEIHNYRFFETFKNILLTIFTMVIIALIMFVIYLLFNQLMEFLISLVKEVVIRVQN